MKSSQGGAAVYLVCCPRLSTEGLCAIIHAFSLLHLYDECIRKQREIEREREMDDNAGIKCTGCLIPMHDKREEDQGMRRPFSADDTESGAQSL